MSTTLELSPTPIIDPEQAPSVGQLLLQQEVIARGDRQLPDEPNRGFEIVRLERGPLGHPAPAREALPLS